MIERDIELFRAFLKEKTVRHPDFQTHLFDLWRAWGLWRELDAKVLCTTPLEDLLDKIGLRVDRRGIGTSLPVVHGIRLNTGVIMDYQRMAREKKRSRL